jgi:hypothetical protein
MRISDAGEGSIKVKSLLDSLETSPNRLHVPPQAPVVCDILLHATNYDAHAAVTSCPNAWPMVGALRVSNAFSTARKDCLYESRVDLTSCFVTTSKKRAVALLEPVEALSVCSVHMSHEPRKVGIRSLDQQVVDRGVTEGSTEGSSLCLTHLKRRSIASTLLLKLTSLAILCFARRTSLLTLP